MTREARTTVTGGFDAHKNAVQVEINRGRARFAPQSNAARPQRGEDMAKDTSVKYSYRGSQLEDVRTDRALTFRLQVGGMEKTSKWLNITREELRHIAEYLNTEHLGN